jgi:hypothetical protein
MSDKVKNPPLLRPLTDGEIADALDKWLTFASNPDDWVVVRALTELHHARTMAEDALMNQAELDAQAMRASCDDDVESCFVGVCG